MADGGFHDQLGGGFHRYSVDARWIVPHFEKMASDNAELLRAYLDGYAAFGTEPLRRGGPRHRALDPRGAGRSGGRLRRQPGRRRRARGRRRLLHLEPGRGRGDPVGRRIRGGGGVLRHRHRGRDAPRPRPQCALRRRRAAGDRPAAGPARGAGRGRAGRRPRQADRGPRRATGPIHRPDPVHQLERDAGRGAAPGGCDARRPMGRRARAPDPGAAPGGAGRARCSGALAGRCHRTARRPGPGGGGSTRRPRAHRRSRLARLGRWP